MSRLLTETEAAQFEKILQDYQPNNEVLDQFHSSNFVVIAGPAGAGKDTLRDGLIASHPDQYLPILSTTTRPPRSGETDGREYHFREISEVQKSLDQQDFFQTALVHGQQVSCLHVDEVRKLKPDQWGLSILVPSTEQELRIIKPDIKTIFLIPPDVETLKRRIQAERMLNEAEIKRRMEAAEKEISYALQADYYYCIVSDAVPKMIDKAHKFLQDKQEGKEVDEDRKARRAMKGILDRIFV